MKLLTFARPIDHGRRVLPCAVESGRNTVDTRTWFRIFSISAQLKTLRTVQMALLKSQNAFNPSDHFD